MRQFPLQFVACLIVVLTAEVTCGQELRVPAFTAYILPSPVGARVSEPEGVTRWNDPTQTVNWYGRFANSGSVNLKVELQPGSGAGTRYRLTVNGKSREAVIAAGSSDQAVANFGDFEIASPGYHRIVLESLGTPGESQGTVQTLIVSGAAAAGAQFNLKERRNAASVHLMYPLPGPLSVDAFYCEVTAVEDPVTTFYMACGWHRGYFGMQVNSETERRIIFSVWDSGDEAVDRAKVADENRVTLLGKGEGVFTGDFGNEGTGGHSHLKVKWKTGEKQRFVVTAVPLDATHTVFSGYWFHPVDQAWMLISSWKAPKEGGTLRGLHSFSENFVGQTGHLLRKARYGNQWIHASDGNWIELTNARFSHDPTGKSDRLDRFMGVEDGQFFLSHGGFRDGFTQYGEEFSRPAVGQPPQLRLPQIRNVPMPEMLR